MKTQPFTCARVTTPRNLCNVLLPLLLATSAAAQDVPIEPGGMPWDWSHRHVLHVNPETLDDALHSGTVEKWLRKADDPRFVLQLERKTRAASGASGLPSRLQPMAGGFAARRPKPIPTPSGIGNMDWNMPLVSGPTAAGVFPAKYSFKIEDTASCANDFVVFPVNAASGVQLVAFNNLYTGPGSTGICFTSAGGQNPTMMWAYNTGRAIDNSPVLSLDGKTVAFADDDNANTVGFHLLRWKSGEGTLTSPTSITQTTTIGSCLPGSASSCMYNLPLTADTGMQLSGSLYVDFSMDVGYLPTTTGRLYRIENVFSADGANPPTATSVVVASGVPLTSPVADGNGNVFVAGKTNGTLYRCTDNGTNLACTGSLPVAFASGTTIVDGPIVTVTGTAANDRVYVFANRGLDYGGGGLNNHSDNAVVVEATISPSFARGGTVDIGLNTTNSIFTGAFDNDYWGATPSSGYLYACGTAAASTTPTLYRIGFAGYPSMGSADATTLALATGNASCSPLTEVYNPGAPARDWLFVSVSANCASGNTSGCVKSLDVIGAAFPSVSNTYTTTGGTGGIVIDNVKTDAQASSLYLGSLGINTYSVPLATLSTLGCFISTCTVTVTTSQPHNLVTGNVVTVAGASSAFFNLAGRTITVTGTTTFTYSTGFYVFQGAVNGTGGTATLTNPAGYYSAVKLKQSDLQ